MVKNAEKYAEEDKKKKEIVEAVSLVPMKIFLGLTSLHFKMVLRLCGYLVALVEQQFYQSLDEQQFYQSVDQ